MMASCVRSQAVNLLLEEGWLSVSCVRLER